MVTLTYDWPTSKWLFQGLLTSILSGFGFVFISLAIEYVKRYSRDKKEREQQILLQKILRGEVTMDWNKAKAVMPVNNACFMPNRPSINNGSLLFNTYKRCGGFLGFGRGYYARGKNNISQLGNDTDDASSRIKEITNWLRGNVEKTEPKVRAEGSSADVLLSGYPSNAPSCDSITTSMKLKGGLFRANLSAASLRSRQRSDTTIKSRGSVCKKMCEEMCQRIVKEHPFIAPLLRRDLLQELRLEVTREPGTSESCLPCNTASNVAQPCKAICQQPNAEDPVITDSKSNCSNKGAQPGSRGPLVKQNKFGTISRTPIIFGKSRKVEANASKQNLTNVSDCRRPLRTGLYSTTPSFNSKFNRGRSCSLSSKSFIKNVESEPRKKGDDFNGNMGRKSVTAARTSEDIAEGGSSVDPATTSVTPKGHFSRRKLPCERWPINNRGAKKETDVPSNKAPNTIKSEYVIGKDRASAEGRMMEIINALKSWGFPVKNQLCEKQVQSFTSVLQKKSEILITPSESQQDEQNTMAPNDQNSAALFDLFQSLTNSPENRKILRQISCVLDKDTCGKVERSSSKVEQIEMCGYVTTRTTGIKQSLMYGREKRFIGTLKNTENTTSPRDRILQRTRTPKPRASVSQRSKSVKLWKESNTLTSKRIEIGRRGSRESCLIHTSKSELLRTLPIDPEDKKPSIGSAKQPNKLLASLSKKPQFRIIKHTVSKKTRTERECLLPGRTKSSVHANLQVSDNDGLGCGAIGDAALDMSDKLNDIPSEPEPQSGEETEAMPGNQAVECTPEAELSRESANNNDLKSHQIQIKTHEESNSNERTCHQLQIKTQEESNKLELKSHQLQIKTQEESNKLELKSHQLQIKTQEESNKLELKSHQLQIKTQEESNKLELKSHQLQVKTQEESNSNDRICHQLQIQTHEESTPLNACVTTNAESDPPEKTQLAKENEMQIALVDEAGSKPKTTNSSECTEQLFDESSSQSTEPKMKRTFVFKTIFKQKNGTKLEVFENELPTANALHRVTSNIDQTCGASKRNESAVLFRNDSFLNSPQNELNYIDSDRLGLESVVSKLTTRTLTHLIRKDIQTISLKRNEQQSRSSKKRPKDVILKDKEVNYETSGKNEQKRKIVRRNETRHASQKFIEISNAPQRINELRNASPRITKPSNVSPRKTVQGHEPLKREPSNEPSRKMEPSNGFSRKREQSNDTLRKREPSSAPSRKREPSNTPSRRREQSNEILRKREPNSAPSRKREPSNKPSRRREQSNETLRKREPSSAPSRKREPSNKPSRRREQSNETSRKKEPSNETSRWREKSNETLRKREPSSALLRRMEPSNESSRRREPSNESSKSMEHSYDTSKNREHRNEVSRKREPNNETSRKREPSNESLKSMEHSYETSRNREHRNETSRKREPSKETLRRREQSNETSRKREPSSEYSRQREPSNESSKSMEHSNETSRKGETSNEASKKRGTSYEASSRKREPNNEVSRQREPSNEALKKRGKSYESSSKKRDPSFEASSRKREPSNEASKKNESSKDSSGKNELSNESPRKKDPSKESLSKKDSNKESIRKNESKNEFLRKGEQCNERSRKKSRPISCNKEKCEQRNELTGKHEQQRKTSVARKQCKEFSRERKHHYQSSSISQLYDNSPGKNETNNETSRSSEPHDDASSPHFTHRKAILIKSESSNEACITCALKDVTSRKCESSNDISRKGEKRTATSIKGEFSNDVSRKIIPKNGLPLNAGKLLKPTLGSKSVLPQQHKPAPTVRNNDLKCMSVALTRGGRGRQTHSVISSIQKTSLNKGNMVTHDNASTSVNNADQQLGESAEQNSVKDSDSFRRFSFKSWRNNQAETKKVVSSRPRSRFDQYQNNKRSTVDGKRTYSRSQEELLNKPSKTKDDEQTRSKKVSNKDKGSQKRSLWESSESSSSGFEKDSADTLIQNQKYSSQEDIPELKSETAIFPAASSSSHVVNVVSLDSATAAPNPPSIQITDSIVSKNSLQPKADDENRVVGNISVQRKPENSSVILRKSVLDDVVKKMSSAVEPLN